MNFTLRMSTSGILWWKYSVSLTRPFLSLCRHDPTAKWVSSWRVLWFFPSPPAKVLHHEPSEGEALPRERSPVSQHRPSPSSPCRVSLSLYKLVWSQTFIVYTRNWCNLGSTAQRFKDYKTLVSILSIHLSHGHGLQIECWGTVCIKGCMPPVDSWGPQKELVHVVKPAWRAFICSIVWLSCISSLGNILWIGH